MESRFVVADEEFIVELKNTSENKNAKRSMDYWTNIFQLGQRREEKMRSLKATKYQSLTKRSPICLPS